MRIIKIDGDIISLCSNLNVLQYTQSSAQDFRKSTVYAICKVNTQMLRKMVCNNMVISVPADGLAVLVHLQTQA